MYVEVLLEACRLSKEDPYLTEEALADLTRAVRLTSQGADACDRGLLAQAVTLLTAALSHVPRFKAAHLPLGTCGSPTRSRPWVALERLKFMSTQMVGLYVTAWDIEHVRNAAQNAVADAASLGLLEQRVYDAWMPGMVSGSGWTMAVAATPLGIVRARQAAGTWASPAMTDIPSTGPTAPIPANPEPVAPQGPAVTLGDPGTACRVLGQAKRPLTDAQHAVVAALRDAGSEGLSKDALESVRSSARRILRDLRRDCHWAQVILLPQQTNGRYRIKL
jgi:hypothetical protein